MKKITIFSLHLGYGGIEKAIVSLANNLVSNYEVEILCVYKLYDTPVFDIDKNINIVYLTDIIPNNKEFIKYLRHLRLFKAFKEGIKGIKYLSIKKRSVINAVKNCRSDIIISTRDYFNKYVGMYKRVNVKTIAWEHNHYHGDMKYVKSLAESCKNIDKLVVVSEELKDFYHNYFFEHSIFSEVVCIPNFLDSIPKTTSKLDKLNVISVGRLSHEKGFSDLIKVFSKVHQLDPNIKLNIVGDGILMDDLKNEIDKNNLNDIITLKGYMDSKGLSKLYNESSLYVMSSLTESFGIVLIEAMSHGLPCIAFDSAEGARELIDELNGYLIENRSIDKMADLIVNTLHDKKALKKLSNNAIKTSKKYSSEVVMKDWINLIEEKL